jgi:hypothetical protein
MEKMPARLVAKRFDVAIEALEALVDVFVGAFKAGRHKRLIPGDGCVPYADRTCLRKRDQKEAAYRLDNFRPLGVLSRSLVRWPRVGGRVVKGTRL